jgi:hypothetical protein
MEITFQQNGTDCGWEPVARGFPFSILSSSKSDMEAIARNGRILGHSNSVRKSGRIEDIRDESIRTFRFTWVHFRIAIYVQEEIGSQFSLGAAESAKVVCRFHNHGCQVMILWPAGVRIATGRPMLATIVRPKEGGHAKLRLHACKPTRQALPARTSARKAN